MKYSIFIIITIALLCGGCFHSQEVVTNEPVEPDPNKRYLTQEVDKCDFMHFYCEHDEVPFFDEVGCGCEPMPEDFKQYCSEDEKSVESCDSSEINHWCGWYDPVQKECGDVYPCAKIFTSRCLACQDQDVIFISEGICPIGKKQTDIKFKEL